MATKQHATRWLLPDTPTCGTCSRSSTAFLVCASDPQINRTILALCYRTHIYYLHKYYFSKHSPFCVRNLHVLGTHFQRGCYPIKIGTFAHRTCISLLQCSRSPTNTPHTTWKTYNCYLKFPKLSGRRTTRKMNTKFHNQGQHQQSITGSKNHLLILIAADCTNNCWIPQRTYNKSILSLAHFALIFTGSILEMQLCFPQFPDCKVSRVSA